ncbi:MAG TPA: helix-turn-helix domain-containing protein [Vicinamibacteria bacterium]
MQTHVAPVRDPALHAQRVAAVDALERRARAHKLPAAVRERRESAGRVVRRRIALEARRLLTHSDLTAAQVGFRLGFDDPAYFARFFRREAGEPPTDFRARARA